MRHFLRFRKPLTPRSNTGISIYTKERTIKYILLIVALIAFSTLVLMPDWAFAAPNAPKINTSVGTAIAAGQPACAGSGSATDWSYCLPIGRWGSYVGSIFSRNEPAGGMLGGVVNAFSMIGTTMRNILPNMFLMLTEVCWNMAYSLTLLAVDFEPLNALGGFLDNTASTWISSITKGNIFGIFLALALGGLIAKAIVGRWNEAGRFARKIGVIIIVFAALGFMGAQASKSTKDAPATGSPWWVVKTINETMNKATVGLNMDSMASSETSMSYQHHGSGERNCQDYLAKMRDQYKKGKTNTGGTPSSMVLTVNQLWEETALRQWVTMQYGNPKAGAQSDTAEAANAMAAYCHVQEATANVAPNIQKEVTNAAYGSNIQDSTARFIFTPQGWIDPWNSAVKKSPDGAMNRDTDTKLTRMAMFWEACTVNANNTGGGGSSATVRTGWNDLFNNLNSSQMQGVRGAMGSWLRPGAGNHKFWAWEKTDDDDDLKNMYGAAAEPFNKNTEDNGTTLSACDSIFFQDPFSKTGDVLDGLDKTDATAAMLGWRFDVPNVDSTWTQTKFLTEGHDVGNGKNSADNGDSQSANKNFAFTDTKKDRLDTYRTIQHIYGNAKVDTLGAFGSVWGGIVSFIVFGLFALIMIITKLMLPLMILFFIFASLLQAFPFGASSSKALLNWAKHTAGVGMLGMFYSVIGSIAVLICNMLLLTFGEMSNGFIYNFMAGSSPALAMLAIGMFCSMMHVGNPFTIKGMLGMSATGGIALKGARTLGRAASRYAAGALGGLGFKRASGLASAAGSRVSRYGDAAKGVSKLEAASRAQQATGDGFDSKINAANSVAQANADKLDDETLRMKAMGGNAADIETYRQRQLNRINATRENGIRVAANDEIARHQAQALQSRATLKRNMTGIAKSAARAGAGVLMLATPFTAPKGIKMIAQGTVGAGINAVKTVNSLNATRRDESVAQLAEQTFAPIARGESFINPFSGAPLKPQQPATTSVMPPVSTSTPPATGGNPTENIKQMQKNWTGTPEEKRAYAREKAAERTMRDQPPTFKPVDHN